MEPFLKWAGGKRWLTHSPYSELLPKPETFDRYFEPFLGGGAVFFYLKPAGGGILADMNADLINTYRVLRTNWNELLHTLIDYHHLHSPGFYYEMRAKVSKDRLQQAARFLYLNRTCWNGLYRVNLQGKFNVPIGTKNSVLFENDDFQALSHLLQPFKLHCWDFERTIDKAEAGDFVFVDPPYTVKHNHNGFIKYNETLFSWSDQIRLRDTVVRAKKRKVKVLVLNADHPSIHELYAGVGDMTVLSRRSVIAGKKDARGVYSELAIKSWSK